MKPMPEPEAESPALRPCRASDRLFYLGYLGAGFTALALAALAIGESNGLLALRAGSALLASGLLRSYLIQTGQFDACADSLEPTDGSDPNPAAPQPAPVSAEFCPPRKSTVSRL
jgi:hypothetical protein